MRAACRFLALLAPAIAAVSLAGCRTVKEIEFDARRPSIEIADDGELTFGGQKVRPEEVAGILESYDIPHDQTIHILLSSKFTDLRGPRIFMGMLAKSGYTRSVLVYKRHAESSARDIEPQYGADRRPGAGRNPSGAKKPFRMKRGDE